MSCKPLKYLLLLFMLLLATMMLPTQLYCQSSKKDINCNLVKAFLDSMDNDNRFHALPKDTALIFLDPNDLMKDCISHDWNGYHITIVKQGPIIDSVRYCNPHFVSNGRCQYLLLFPSLDGKDLLLFLHHLCSNEVSSAKIKRRKGQYYIAAINYGVF